MDLRKFDLNLLLVLDALLKERTVTRAAQRLNQTQPTVSVALGKLRVLFQDELFVKMHKGMEPTALALAMEAPLGDIFASIQQKVLNRSAFNPQDTDRTFSVIGGEMGQMVFTHRLLLPMSKAAPSARFKFMHPDAVESLEALEDGRADVAIGYFPRFRGAHLFQQQLFARPLMCLARADHPVLARDGLTLQNFFELGHASVAMMSMFDDLIEPVLKRLKYTRNCVVELAHTAGTPHLLANSDLIAVVPEALAVIYCQSSKLKAWDIPLPLPLCEVRQFWHRRVHGDPAVRWLRQFIAKEFHQTVEPALEPNEEAKVVAQ